MTLAAFFQILITLSNVHDVEIAGLDQIETLIGNLLSNSETPGQASEFACFACADFIQDQDALDDHLASHRHNHAAGIHCKSL